MLKGLMVLGAAGFAALAAGCGPRDGYAESFGDGAGSSGDAWGNHPPPAPGPTAADICAEFEEGLGDDRLEADIYAELGNGEVHLVLSHTDAPLPECQNICSDGWIVSLSLPLPHQGSFDLAANETLGDFTLSQSNGKKCGCLSGWGVTSGSIDIVAMDAQAVCGWMVEDDLFDVSGGFAALVQQP